MTSTANIHHTHVEVRVGGQVIFSRICETGKITYSSRSVALQARAYELPEIVRKAAENYVGEIE